MKRLLSIFIISALLSGCFGNKSTFNENGRIEKLGVPIRIEYYENLHGNAFQHSDAPTFVIINNQELKTVIAEIKNADNPEPWKGAGWDKIKIYYPDTILNLNTNKRKIGISASGTFYDLDKENFITKRTEGKTTHQTGSDKHLNADTTTEFYSSTEKLKSNHIPDSIFQMTSLKHLSIQGMDCDYRVSDDKGNDITKCWMINEISPQIKNLKHLETLQLNVNAISKIPIELIELKKLKSLDLTDNSGLSDIDNLVNLENLETLSLNGCNISKMPDNISQLKKLKSLGLAGNNLSEQEKERIKKALPTCETYF